jgi:hypothetical protein
MTKGALRARNGGLSISIGIIRFDTHSKVHQNLRLSCPDTECSKVYASLATRNHHYKMQHSRRKQLVECPDPECKKTYKSFVCAARHHKEKHQGNNSTYTCKHPGCPLIFISRYGANYHFQKQHGMLSTQRFPCPEPRCALVFRSKRGAQQHHRSQHTTLGPIDKHPPNDTLCNYSDCSQVFASGFAKSRPGTKVPWYRPVPSQHFSLGTVPS